MPTSSDLSILSDYVALVYHEARNVRHLIEGGYEDAESWAALTNLARDRNKAWKQMLGTRREAEGTSCANSLLAAYEGRFGVDLPTLRTLFQNPNWKHAKAYGGHAWVPITEDVIRLAEAIENDDDATKRDVLDRLSEARHNTGKLRDKLERLNSQLTSS